MEQWLQEKHMDGPTAPSGRTLPAVIPAVRSIPWHRGRPPGVHGRSQIVRPAVYGSRCSGVPYWVPFLTAQSDILGDKLSCPTLESPGEWTTCRSCLSP